MIIIKYLYKVIKVVIKIKIVIIIPPTPALTTELARLVVVS